MPKIIFEAFCKEDLFLRVNEAQQKYQKLSQLFPWPITLHLVVSFHLQTNTTPARPEDIMDKDQTVDAKCQDLEPYHCCLLNAPQLVH